MILELTYPEEEGGKKQLFIYLLHSIIKSSMEIHSLLETIWRHYDLFVHFINKVIRHWKPKEMLTGSQDEIKTLPGQYHQKPGANQSEWIKL